MRWRICALFLSGAGMLSGCAGMLVPPRQETFTGLDAAAEAPVYAGLTVAVVSSANTRNTVKEVMKWSIYGLAQYDGTAAVERVYSVFRQNFKEVVRANGFEEARKSKADLIAVFDDYLAYGGPQTKEDVRVVFMTMGQEKIEEFSYSFKKIAAWTPRADMERCAEEREKRLGPAIRNSKALADFAKTRPVETGAPALAAGPAATRESDVDSPGYSRPGRPDDFALVVGIEKYSGLPDADFAERDAAAVRAHLLALGFPERNVVFLRGAQAGRAGIEKYVESWLPRNVKEDSKVVFYFSGHGAPDPASGQAYLVPWDGDAKFLENTGYPLERLYRKLDALKAREVLLAMDACFSGYGGHSVVAKGTRPLVTKIDDARGALGRMVALSASSLDEVTGTDEAQGHGLFTYHLLKGLQQMQGQATARQLYEYLRPKVQDAARRQNRDQTPQLLPADAARAGLHF
ncbi:MAG: caspase family protein [Elusimicrobia bacterium]|nr:caspase family protein [Elusimicrobiota bacterium]